MRIGITYFKRFKTDVQKMELELFNNSKYYNKNLHRLVDFMSEFNRDKKPKKNENNGKDILMISDLESGVKLYCSSCDCSHEYKNFCANNLIASLQSTKNIEMLKKLYCNYKCSFVLDDLNPEFGEFGIA